MNSSISECDHKCETPNAEPEIGTDRSSQPWQNPRVDGNRFEFDPPTVSRWGFWPVLEPNRSVVAVQTRTTGGLPGPVANTSHQELCGKYSTDEALNEVYTVACQCEIDYQRDTDSKLYHQKWVP
jgi:hypothetical protein